MKIASFFNSKAKKWINGRKSSNLIFKNRDFSKDLYWLHVSSLGEYEQGLPVLNALKLKFPNSQFAISFFSPSGYEIIKSKNTQDFIFYFPLDTQKNAQKIIQNLNPKCLFLVKYDYWYIILDFLQKKNIPIFVISAKFRKNFIAFKKYGQWFYEIHKKINYYFVQDKESYLLLIKNNINQTIISGDTRFDRVKELLKISKDLSFLDDFKEKSLLLVAGSTWEKDDKILLNMKLNTKIKLCIVPHEINQEYIKKLQNKFKNSVLYSEIKGKKINEFSVLIIDIIGILTKIYPYSDFAYIGGAFDKDGVHNVLEPAIFGVPVFFGPNIKKFDEAKKLIDEKGGFIINNSRELENKLNFFVEDVNKRNEYGKNAKNMILNQENATDKIIKYII